MRFKAICLIHLFLRLHFRYAKLPGFDDTYLRKPLQLVHIDIFELVWLKSLQGKKHKLQHAKYLYSHEYSHLAILKHRPSLSMKYYKIRIS